jgi:hypothetical protein
MKTALELLDELDEANANTITLSEAESILLDRIEGLEAQLELFQSPRLKALESNINLLNTRLSRMMIFSGAATVQDKKLVFTPIPEAKKGFFA